MESITPAASFNFPGMTEVLEHYQAKAAGEKIDPIGYGFVPFGYAAGQVLAQAVEGAKSLDPAKLADFMHHHTFQTVVGDIAYADDGAWGQPRTLFTQFQNVAPGNLDQFRDGRVQPILWPPQYKTGAMIYPYAAAKK
jgi:branched-chain amino acid transport system substrate-binding protein